MILQIEKKSRYLVHILFLFQLQPNSGLQKAQILEQQGQQHHRIKSSAKPEGGKDSQDDRGPCDGPRDEGGPCDGPKNQSGGGGKYEFDEKLILDTNFLLKTAQMWSHFETFLISIKSIKLVVIDIKFSLPKQSVNGKIIFKKRYVNICVFTVLNWIFLLVSVIKTASRSRSPPRKKIRTSSPHGMASPEIEPEEVKEVVNIGMEQY